MHEDSSEAVPSIAGVLSSPAIEALADAVEAGALVPRFSTGIVMVSGGADSACAAAAVTALCGPEHVAAIHVNYALRDDSDADERAARALCAKLRIDLHVERPRLGAGNVQAQARDARYAAAERLRGRLGADWIATGHTRTDVAETVLYRLAASPGTRPLLGLPPRNGKVVRPLYSISREETRAVAEEARLPFVDDPSNESDAYARNRIRAEVLPVLAELAPEVERNVAATHAELHEEAELLAGLVADALDRAGVEPGGTRIDADQVAGMPPGLRRLALRELAGRAAGRPVPVSRSRAAQIARVGGDPEGGEVELTAGVLALCEAGSIEMTARREPVTSPGTVRLPVPGTARFGGWELRAEVFEPPADPAGPDVATLDAVALGPEVEVRAWREGDRIRPLGLDGSKSLQDLFTDHGVPRSQRGRIPIVVAGGEVAWVAGIAIGEAFRLTPGSSAAVLLTAEALVRT